MSFVNDRAIFVSSRSCRFLLLLGRSLLGRLRGFLCALGAATGQLLVGTGHADRLEHAVLLLLVGDGAGLDL